MASLYKNGIHYYVPVFYKDRRRSISTGNLDKRNAPALKSKLELIGAPRYNFLKAYSVDLVRETPAVVLGFLFYKTL